MVPPPEGTQMFLSQDEPAFDAVCAAVALNNPHMPLRKVEETAAALAEDKHIAYLALCVTAGAEPQEKLTAAVAAHLQENEGRAAMSGEFTNDTVTEQALGRLAENAHHTAQRLTGALEAARNVRDTAWAAQARGLRDEDLNTIKVESLRMASSLGFAKDHGDIVTDAVIKIGKHREGQS